MLRIIDTANVCCGLHAGSAALAIETAVLCRELDVEVVAHPGYEDRERFGREELGLTPPQIERLVAFQVGALAAIVRIHFVKPHGALYHRCQTDPEAAQALLRALAPAAAGVVGQPGLGLIEAARAAGVPYRREGFADRAYGTDGALLPRSEPGALLEPLAAAEQARELAGTEQFDTICVHSDSPRSLEVARAVRAALTPDTKLRW